MNLITKRKVSCSWSQELLCTFLNYMSIGLTSMLRLTGEEVFVIHSCAVLRHDYHRPLRTRTDIRRVGILLTAKIISHNHRSQIVGREPGSYDRGSAKYDREPDSYDILCITPDSVPLCV